MSRSLSRIEKQASDFEFFDNVYALNENAIPSYFKEKLRSKFKKGSRGYGYWSWKPAIILDVLSKINDGDCILYADAGCHLNIGGKKRLSDYFEILSRSDKGIVAFQADVPCENNSKIKYDGRKLFDQPNYQWIKGDLLDYFGVRENISVLNAQAIGAGIILFKKCKKAVEIVKEWESIALNRFDLIDDTISKSQNVDGFIEHRHDQAVWSLICLKHEIQTISAYEYWYPKAGICPQEPDWKALESFPIHAMRDKDMGALLNLYYSIKVRLRLLLKGIQ